MKIARALLTIPLLAALLLSGCSARKIKLPNADSIRVEPAGKNIHSPMQTAKLAAFIEGLPENWGQTWQTPRAGGVTLLFQNGGEITTTVRIGENWISVSSGTTDNGQTKSLSKVDREKLDKLLAEAQRE